MPIAPETLKIPGIIEKFNRSGLTLNLILDLIDGHKSRNIILDAEKLVREYEKDTTIEITGTENIPQNKGCLLVFNHPNMDVLLPAILKLMVKVNEKGGARPVLLMGAEIPLTGKFNESYPIPGSPNFIKRFHGLYSENIISVPISTSREDYLSGRLTTARRAESELKKGNMILISPEGHVEMKNEISPKETFHLGSGRLAMIAAKNNAQILAVGIWKDEETRIVRVNIGPQFRLNSNKSEAAVELMAHVADLMPAKLRGPFKPQNTV